MDCKYIILRLFKEGIIEKDCKCLKKSWIVLLEE